MAQIIDGVSRTFNEFLLLPNRTRTDCSAETVDLRTPLVRHARGETAPIELHIPLTSAIMQAVSSAELAIALARNGGLSFLHHNRSVDEHAVEVRAVKNFKAGFVVSDTNVRPADTLDRLRELMRQTGHSTAAVTDDGSATGRFLVHDYHMALALAMGADFVMMGRYFARFDQAPGARIPTRDGYVKEYWGEGSNRARNWQRYGQGGQHLIFEEGVDGFVQYAGDLNEGVATTIAKIKATMTSCGAVSVREFRETARLTVVSAQSIEESHATVSIRETPASIA